ncbi:MAG TPA: sigma-70 family RNA polymerase sigma factor [Anaerolineae bacterium]|nr:sigma-70 family RNA polymerase sigma factor [Anaerolineae bacterium]HQH37039.1 sigma-70 family RNA polymerase sigma factor [Anaerolineae bacterium]
MSPQQKTDYDEVIVIQRAKKNDRIAQGQLYEHYVDAVYRYMLYRTGDPTVAEDLTAEVFAQMLVSLARYEERGLPFGAWLFRIAKARLVDYWRATKRRERQAVALSAEAETFWVSDDSPVDIQEYQDLLKAMEYLTEAEREVILLRFASALNNQEIAKVVHRNPDAVKSMMYRALRKLRDILVQREKFYDTDTKGCHTTI